MTLYDAFVPGCLQILHSILGLLEKGQAYCDEQQIPAGELIHAQLAPDMHDFAYQVKSCVVHSVGAIQGVRNGNFSPDTSTPPDGFDSLKARVDEAIRELKALNAIDLNALSDKPITFMIGDKLLWNFVGNDFLLSFSQPNFYFHASTAYGLLRMKGVPIGKRDYLGSPRMLP